MKGIDVEEPWNVIEDPPGGPSAIKQQFVRKKLDRLQWDTHTHRNTHIHTLSL